MPMTPDPGSKVIRIAAGAIVDADGVVGAPGVILLQRDPIAGAVESRSTVLAHGRAEEVDAHPAAPGAERVDRPRSVVLPGLVNAHTHLDLTGVGPIPFDPAGGFSSWIDMVRRRRETSDPAIHAAVVLGSRLAVAGGTVAVGDIAGAHREGPSRVPRAALISTPLAGISFVEYFAIGRAETSGLAGLDRVVESMAREGVGGRVRLGIQPHAPYTVSPAGYRHGQEVARRHGLPLATHAAESIAEHEFIARGTGPQLEFLEKLGAWEPGAVAGFGRGETPVAHLAPFLRRSTFVLAHVNDASDADIGILARTGQRVAYCPRSSAYFGHERSFGAHRYRDMLGAGIIVALGTDSIINLPAHAASEARGGISVLDEMRLLVARDGARPLDVLRMGTINGAIALGLDPAGFRLRTGSRPMGVAAFEVPGPIDGADPLASLLKASETPAEFLFNANGVV